MPDDSMSSIEDLGKNLYVNHFCLKSDFCSGYTTANAKVLLPKIFPTLQEGRVRLMVFMFFIALEFSARS